MSNLQVFTYEGNQITFSKNGNVYANATEMARSFGNEKRPQFWLNNNYANEFLSEISKARNIALADLVIVRKGGNNPGTWMHEDVALEFSRWLSPAFSIWCNDHIKQLLQTGETRVGSLSEDEVILKAMQTLQSRVVTTTRQLAQVTQIMQEQAPKVEYYDEVLSSEGLISTTIIAKELGMSAVKLNMRLQGLGIIYKSGKTWVPYSKYHDKGYLKTKTYPYIDRKGQKQTSIVFYWTELGRQFLRHKLIQTINKVTVRETHTDSNF